MLLAVRDKKEKGRRGRMIKANIQIHIENETIKVNDSDHTLKGEEISSKLKLHVALQRKVQNKS